VLVSDINRGLFVLQPQGLVEPELNFAGNCPGSITVTASNMSPNGTVGLAWGTSLGVTTIPGGACAGVDLDIAGAQLLTTITADASGNAVFPDNACGNFLVAVDIATCDSSNVITID